MTQQNKAAWPHGENANVEVSVITPHNKALYEAGKSLLVDSVKTGREFCKFMIGVATGAIPTYLGLLKFALNGGPRRFGAPESLYLIPPTLFLVAAIVFVIGFFPKRSNFSLDVVEEIEEERRKIVTRRQRLATAGFTLFVVGVGCATAVLMVAMTKI